jgi:hypothetical protein
MYELPDEDDHVRHRDSSSPTQSVVSMSLSASVPPLRIPDHYSEYEAAHHSERRQQYVDRLLNSKVYGQEQTTSWTKRTSPKHKKIVMDDDELLLPPSINESSRRHTHGSTPVRMQSPVNVQDNSSQHPLRQAFINKTKTLDLTPLALTSRSIGTHVPKQRTPHKSFKDHTTSSRSKKLPEKSTGLFSGVRSPGQWCNSQAHLEFE